MLLAISHRGPDGEGVWSSTYGEWQVTLGHRRLAIIDVPTGGQPMGNDTLKIVFNGEIYNFLQLRQDLETKGHQFHSQSDTESILVSYQQYGLDAIEKLNGMFAFALWDASKHRLVLARDRSGIKPLYYAPLPDGGLVFSSELTSLLQMDVLHPKIHTEGLISLFFSDYIHPPHTIVEGVYKLPPASMIVWEQGNLSAVQTFWKPSIPNLLQRTDKQELARELWQRLGDCVERQLVADVPIGIFLSGGIDSSAVAALAAQRASKGMKAFSIGFQNKTFDESDYAKLVANAVGVELISETLDEQKLLEIAELAIDHLDEPLADPSLLPTYLLSKLAARHVKVVVGGDGGDELWAGYPTYLAHQLAKAYEIIPLSIRNKVIERLVEHLPIDDRYQSLEWKLRRFVQRWDNQPESRHVRWMSSVDLPQIPQIIRNSLGILPPTMLASLPQTSDQLHRLLVLDFTTYLSGSVLTKVDRASMAHGLEARPPFLDNEMIQFAMSIPSSYKLRGNVSKYLFKLAARKHLPNAIIDRPKKGFGIPLAAWMRGPFARQIAEVIHNSSLWDQKILHRPVFAQWYREHIQKKADHSKPLWALFVLDRWFRKHKRWIQG
jgi:asparagine synthase (glutamine-hydrolysing)